MSGNVCPPSQSPNKLQLIKLQQLLWHTVEVLDKNWKEHLTSHLLAFLQRGNHALK